MPNSDLCNQVMAKGLGILPPSADASRKRKPTSEQALNKQTRLRGWLRDAFLSGPLPRRCRRWDLLRELRRELDQRDKG